MNNGQLTLKNIYDLAAQLKKQGEDISKYPIYIGDDDELNGIHCGWYTNILDVKNDDEDNQYMIEMAGGITNKAILIS